MSHPNVPSLRVNGARLRHSLEEMARIGATPRGGVSRPALSDADRQGRDLFARWMAEAGLQVRFDDVGNQYGRRKGRREDLAPAMIGSHLDSIPQGGRFDGAYGVLAALEVARVLNDSNVVTQRPIEIVSWTNEEGARFQPSCLGSGVVAGAYELDYAYARADYAGKKFGDELRRIGYLGDRAARPGTTDTYLELHIEQGPVLEAEGLQIGVVDGIVGIYWGTVEVTGQAQHAGPTPMAHRRDPMVAAARIIARLRDIARAADGATVTVGRLDAEPAIINAIPGRVRFTLDIRHPDGATVARLRAAMADAAVAIAREERCEARFEDTWNVAETRFSPEAMAAVEAGARAFGYSFRRITAGAAHDAKYMSHLCRTGMIFVPSKDGKSHCEEEESSWEELERGCNVLLHATLRFAGLQ